MEEEDSFSEPEVEVQPTAPRVRFTENKQAEPADDDDFVVVGKGGKAASTPTAAPVKLTPEALFKALKHITDQRGKKSTDRSAMVQSLRDLYVQQCSSPYQSAKVLLVLIPAQFDLWTGSATSGGYIPTESWHKYDPLDRFANLVLDWPRISVH